MVMNNDWDHEYLLYSYLNLLKADVSTFLRFLEQCVHPIVITDAAEVTERVFVFNEALTVDGYEIVEIMKLSIRTVFKAHLIDLQVTANPRKGAYEVVLSFAGKYKEYVRDVARYLQSQSINLFYDEDEKVELWGKDLVEELARIYGGQSRYCVMFISKSYAEKMWPRWERQNAIAAAIERDDEYVLPARFDSTRIEGIRRTIAYVDLSHKTPEKLGEMIAEKLRRLGTRRRTFQ